MLTIHKRKIFGNIQYNVEDNGKIIGLIFKQGKQEKNWPDKFQVTGDNKRTFYPTLEKSIEHFKS